LGKYWKKYYIGVRQRPRRCKGKRRSPWFDAKYSKFRSKNETGYTAVVTESKPNSHNLKNVTHETSSI
jgi:hypothetical protein